MVLVCASMCIRIVYIEQKHNKQCDEESWGYDIIQRSLLSLYCKLYSQFSYNVYNQDLYLSKNNSIIAIWNNCISKYYTSRF